MTRDHEQGASATTLITMSADANFSTLRKPDVTVRRTKHQQPYTTPYKSPYKTICAHCMDT